MTITDQPTKQFCYTDPQQSVSTPLTLHCRKRVSPLVGSLETSRGGGGGKREREREVNRELLTLC